MADESINGISVTEQSINSWVSEAEAGYPVEKLRKRGRKPLGNSAGDVIPVRMDPALLEALMARAEREHVTRSEAIRAAVRSWIDVA